MDEIITRASIVGNDENYADEIKPISMTFTESTLLPVLKQIVEFCINHLKEETESVNQIKEACEQIWGHESYCDQIRSCCDLVIYKMHKTSRSIIHLCQTLTNLNITPELSKEELNATPSGSNKSLGVNAIVNALFDNQSNVEQEIKTRCLMKRQCTVNRSETNLNITPELSTLESTFSSELSTDKLDSAQSNTVSEKVIDSQLVVDAIGNDHSEHEKTTKSKKGSYMVTTMMLSDADLFNHCADVGNESSQGPYLVAITPLEGDSSPIKLSEMHPTSHDLSDQSQYRSDEDESNDEDENDPVHNVSNEMTDHENKDLSCGSTHDETTGKNKQNDEETADNELNESIDEQSDIQAMQHQAPVETFTCNICSSSFRCERSLARHKSTHKHKYRCKFCAKTFAKQNYLKKHVVEKHDDLNDWNPREREEEEEEEKEEEEDDDKDDKDDKDEERMRNELMDDEMLRAVKKERIPQSGICDVCGKFFNYLRKHKLTHKQNTFRPFQCEECGKTFKSIHNLNNHQNIHKGIKPYSCPVCNKCFCGKSVLQKHRAIHTGEGKHVCEICGKRTHQKHNLLVHMRTHTGHKPFSCKRCGRKFAHNVSVRDHKCISGVEPVDKKKKKLSNNKKKVSG